MFDMWISTAFNTSTNEHHGTPDMKLTRHDKQHFCWSTEGPVRTASTDQTVNGARPWLIPSPSTSTLVDCAIAITANSAKGLYTDGADLKMGRYAIQSQTYWDGPRWHTRTIGGVNATHLALDMTLVAWVG